MFTPEKTKIMNRISQLEDVAKGLLSQKNSLPKKDVLRNGYTLAINEILVTIKNLAKELTKEEPRETDEEPDF